MVGSSHSTDHTKSNNTQGTGKWSYADPLHKETLMGLILLTLSKHCLSIHSVGSVELPKLADSDFLSDLIC